MAGSVERRMNDKFYFVVDEVGGSSGIESETESVDFIPSKDSSGYTDNKNSCKDETSIVTDKETESSMCSSRISDPEGEKNISSVNSEKKETTKTSPNEYDKTEVQQASRCNYEEHVSSDCENLNAVNMDIDNDSDEIDKVLKKEMAPVIKISFRDEKAERCYKSSLLKFLTQKIHPCTVLMNSENSLQLEIYEEETGNLVDDNVLDFHLDTTPHCNTHNDRIPSYSKNNEIVLSDSNSQNQTNPKIEMPFSVCFNCCKKHLLRDCPEHRNMERIIFNRNRFQSANKLQKNRYHLDENQRFSNLVPGELSKKLRNALDLKKDQQPLFIYRMRLLGYPPAWLEEARVSHSGVAIYDSNGQPIIEEDEEEGEIIPENAKDRFDISKIIEFPGFNVPLPKNMKEEGKLHSCPAISEEQSKENLIKVLQPNAVQAYKKRTLTLQKYSTPDANFTNRDRKRLPSPTIEEMEEKKRLLLLALNDEDGNGEFKLNQSNVEDVPEPKTEPSTPEDKSKHVKNLDLGTPVLKSISLYSKLPPREQFSVNVSEVINYENLPNSTGKYESMSNLILKIRDTVSRIQNE